MGIQTMVPPITMMEKRTNAARNTRPSMSFSWVIVRRPAPARNLRPLAKPAALQADRKIKAVVDRTEHMALAFCADEFYRAIRLDLSNMQLRNDRHDPSPLSSSCFAP